MTTDHRIVDLHAHSSASSGAWGTPACVAGFFKSHGYAAFAVTDHDALEAQQAAACAAAGQGLEYLTGIEVSALVDDPHLPRQIVHILGYMYEPTVGLRRLSRRNLAGSAEGWRRFRDECARRGLGQITDERLRRHIRTTFGEDDIWKQPSDHGPIGDLLREDGGLPKDRSKSAQALRAEIGPPLNWPDPANLSEVCRTLRAAGAVVILAHPVLPGAPTDPAERQRLRYWLENHVDGLEVYTPKHPPAYQRFLLDLVHEMGRPFTGGSDRHQYQTPQQLSNAPYACVESLRQFKAAGRAGVSPVA